MANNRIAYGLADEYNINTEGMEPHQVWEALSNKGISVHGEHEKNAKKSKEELLEEASRFGSIVPGKGELVKIPLHFFSEENKLASSSETEILKGVRSLKKRIAEHEQKLAHPESLKNWDKCTPAQKAGHIQHWKKELVAFKKSVLNREKELEKRKNDK